MHGTSMRHRLLAPLLALLAACGGGGGSGGGGPPPPPPPPAPGGPPPPPPRGGGGAPPPPPPPFSVTKSTGLAVAGGFANAAALGTVALFTVSEAESGADLNGDGDTLDAVVHRLDVLTDAITNLGFAALGPILASDTQFAFLVPESGQGATNFNGDADASDAVWFVYSPGLPTAADNPFNSQVATPAGGLPGAAAAGGFVFLWSEAAAGFDFTGDGDLSDNLVAAFIGATRFVSPFPLFAHAAGRPLVARGAMVALAISEAAAGADRNGDGDAIDQVLVAVRFSASTALPLAVGGGGFARAVANLPYALTDGAVVYLIDEASDGGFDRNGDGDAADAVLAVFDVATASGETLPMNGALGALGVACSAAVGIGTSADRAVVGIDERAQGQSDLNGDMDFFDAVAGWVDTAGARGTVHFFPFTLASRTPAIAGHRGVLPVNERSMGILFGVDLNGDGDDTDDVAFLLDAESAPGSLLNLGLALGTLSLSGSDAVLGIPEGAQGGIDRNGDGDAGDTVLAHLDLGDTPPTLRATGLVALATAHFRLSAAEFRLAALAAEGQSPTFDRLNGDGDRTDHALVLLHHNPALSPPALLPPTPLVAGTASAFVAPPLGAGPRVWLFATSEAMAGADLNGDGDFTDTVLSYVRLSTP